MISLYAVRHGETDYNREDRVQGTAESVLTDFGMSQAKATAKVFKGMRVDAIYSSPLKRAYATAEEIGKTLDIDTVQAVPEFGELNCGTFEGMLIEEIRKTRWQEWLDFLADPAIAPPGGESMNQLYQRVSRALDAILRKTGEDDTVVIVCHAGTVRMILAHLMKIPVASAVNFGLSNASIARFINKHGRWTCLGWNGTDHLGGLEGEVKFVL